MEECEDVACKDKADLLRSMMGAAYSSTSAPKSKSNNNSKEDEGRGLGGDNAPGNGELKMGCPLDRGELGHATWGFLHTAAANYPEAPSPVHQTCARKLLEGLAQLYPCKYCAKDLQENMKEYPPDVESRKAFSLWLCRQHNMVNVKLGKAAFPCEMEVLDERWKTGRPECWGLEKEEE